MDTCAHTHLVHCVLVLVMDRAPVGDSSTRGGFKGCGCADSGGMFPGLSHLPSQSVLIDACSSWTGKNEGSGGGGGRDDLVSHLWYGFVFRQSG
jgi:hypothetical protein